MKLGIILVTILLMVSCGPARKVTYHDTSLRETTTEAFGMSDLQLIAEKMVTSLGAFKQKYSEDFEGKERPTVYLGKVENRTMEHLDMLAIVSSIRKGLIQDREFRFLDMSMEDERNLQLQHQSDAGVVDQKQAKQRGRTAAGDYVLYGHISEIKKRTSRINDNYYKFTLNLMNVESGVIAWSEEQEIRKTGMRKVVGR